MFVWFDARASCHLRILIVAIAICTLFPHQYAAANEQYNISIVSMQIENIAQPGLININVQLDQPACFKKIAQTLVPLGTKRLNKMFEEAQKGHELADIYLQGSLVFSSNLIEQSGRCSQKTASYTLGPIAPVQSLDEWKENTLISVELLIFVDESKPTFDFYQFFTWPSPISQIEWENMRALQIWREIAKVSIR